MISSYLLIVAAVVFVPNGVLGRHFRGGYISWAPTGREREIELFFRLAYRHGFFSDPETSEVGEDCTRQAIRTKTPIRTGGEFTCITTTFEDGERIEEETDLFDGDPPYYTCTNIKDSGDDVDLHWASGYNRTIITLPESSNQVWSVGYDACCWLNTLVNYNSPRSWRLRAKVDLSPRNDLDGRANTSPYVEGLPLKTVAQGCITAIPINAIDRDGDRVSCRWTSGRKAECEENCGNPDSTIFTMKESSCKILVNAVDAEPGFYAVAVIIEDYPMGRRRRSPYSKISYQFLVTIQPRNVECNRVVTIMPERACYAVPFVAFPPFRIDLEAQTEDPSVPIISIDMITQPGMEVSDLIEDGNGRYHVEVSWTPTVDKVGNVEQLCYQALDAENIAGQEICVKLFVGGVTPELVPELSYPSLNVTPETVPFLNDRWEICFTDLVQLDDSSSDTKVTFLFGNGTKAYSSTLRDEANKVNISRRWPFCVSFFTPDFEMIANTNYTIRLETGFAVGSEGCHLPTEEFEWRFITSLPAKALTLELDPYPEGVWVECLPTFMVTYIESDLVPNIDLSILSYEDPDCFAVVHNESHIALGTMYGKCGTKAIVNEDQTRVSMINTIFLPRIGDFIFGDALTRSENVEVKINCSIPTRRVAYVEFDTNATTSVIEKDQTGDYDFSLKLFPSDDYRRPYRVWDFPVSVEANRRLYFEARTFDNDDVSPYLRECVATPTEDPRSSLRYVIIRDGCPIDQTITFHRHSSSKRVRFSIEAFSFIGYNLQSTVFVHCDIVNCNPLNGSCDTNCPEPEVNPNLSKRSVSGIKLGTHDENTDGPIRIVTKGENGAKDQPDGFSFMEVSLMLLVSVSMVMIVVLAYFVVKVSKQLNRPNVCTSCAQKSGNSKLALISAKSKI